MLDYGGTIDTNGLHWGIVMWDMYQKNKVPIAKEEFELAFSYGERTLAVEKHIYPGHNFFDTLLIKTRLQFEFLAKENFLPTTNYDAAISAVASGCNTFAQESIDKAKPVLDELAAKYKLVLVSNFYGNIETVLEHFGISYELSIVSAHRTPERMVEFAKNAADRGIKVIIAGAGGAAHLPGMVASITPLPVIGVPVLSSNSIDGWDSVLSILQMPNGVPVATVALNAAKNAGILAMQILGTADKKWLKKSADYKKKLEAEVLKKLSKFPPLA